jgi:hypothetical protein
VYQLRQIAVCATCLTIAGVASGAIDVALSDRDITRALQIGTSDDRRRAQFHASYLVPVQDPTVERMEIITEFRRLVLITEERQRIGDWLFSHGGVRDPRAALLPWKGRLSIVVRLKFHPQNTLSDVPAIETNVDDGSGHALRPLDVIRTSITAPLSGKAGDVFAPLLGATIESVFDAASIGEATRWVSVSSEGQLLTRVAVDFSKLE